MGMGLSGVMDRDLGWLRGDVWHYSPQCTRLGGLGKSSEVVVAGAAKRSGSTPCDRCCSPARIAWFTRSSVEDLPKLVPTPAEMMVLVAWFLGACGHVLCCETSVTAGTFGPWYSIDAATWEERYGSGRRRRIELAMANGGG